MDKLKCDFNWFECFTRVTVLILRFLVFEISEKVVQSYYRFISKIIKILCRGQMFETFLRNTLRKAAILYKVLPSRIQIHKASMQFHAWKHMIRVIPYDFMHGTIAYRPSMQFHAWNHMIPYMEVHGTI